MNSPNESISKAFEQLDPGLQKWVYKSGWSELRDIQEKAINHILNNHSDMIIASATASGKTEAAFLPIISSALSKSNKGLFCIYIAPLKALINDQFSRLEDLAKYVDIEVIPWHGDINSSTKKKLYQDKSKILLITPESIESHLINRTGEFSDICKSVESVIVDELHTFIGNERGIQLMSQLSRIDLLRSKRIRRIGLSATLGDVKLTTQFLSGQDECEYIESKSFSKGLKMKLFTVIDDQEDDILPKRKIGEQIYSKLRGEHNLIFANSRSNVEEYSDLLREYCERDHVPIEFYPHHGSLSKSHREYVESKLKSGSKPATAVCTTTLEMGIDIGNVSTIGQIGCPPSVSSLVQRIGRSGRREEDAKLRFYLIENDPKEAEDIEDYIHPQLVQSLAMIDLMLQKWVEPPSLTSMHFSTMVQQVLSLICQYGSISASDIYKILVEKGVFKNVSIESFKELLLNLGEKQVIKQLNDGTLILDLKGEHITNNYKFYAAFETPEEFKLFFNNKHLGQLPVTYPLIVGTDIVFAGQRWTIKAVDKEKNIVELTKSFGKKIPLFSSGGIHVHDKIRQSMYEIYKASDSRAYIDDESMKVLVNARQNFKKFKLHQSNFITQGKSLVILPWRGSKIMNALNMILLSIGFKVSNRGISLEIQDCTEGQLRKKLNQVNLDSIDPLKMASRIENKAQNKFDYLLSESLLNEEYISSNVDIEGAYNFLNIL